MDNLFEIASSVSSPLALGGLFAAIVFFIFKQIVAKDFFKELTTAHSAEIIKLIINKLFILALISMTLGFIAFIVPKIIPAPEPRAALKNANPEPQGNKLVIEAKRRVVDLRGDFEALAKNPETRGQIISDGIRLGSLLEGASDNTLDAKRTIIKYEYAGWAFLIAGRATEDSGRKNDLIKKAARSLELALEKMKLAEYNYRAGLEGSTELYEFIVGESADISRTKWLLATAYAIQARNFKSRAKHDATSLISEIDESFLKKYPPKSEPDLAWALSSR